MNEKNENKINIRKKTRLIVDSLLFPVFPKNYVIILPKLNFDKLKKKKNIIKIISTVKESNG